jgi:hypothetical protein
MERALFFIDIIWSVNKNLESKDIPRPLTREQWSRT